MTLSKDSEITLDVWKSDMESVEGLDIAINETYLPILFYHYGNQLESLSSSGCCALTDNVSLLVIPNMFIFFFCLNNVQYVNLWKQCE